MFYGFWLSAFCLKLVSLQLKIPWFDMTNENEQIAVWNSLYYEYCEVKKIKLFASEQRCK